MDRRVLVAGIAALMLASTVGSAAAQCSFEHPRRFSIGRHPRNNNQFLSGLVPAFVSCGNPGGNVPNATTEGGVPSCAPPQTMHQQAGSPTGGWMWDEGRAQGEIEVFPTRNFVSSPLNPPGDTVDVTVNVRLRGVIDANGPADGLGTVGLVLRITMDDRDSGDMTIVDFPVVFQLTVNNGNASLRTTVNALLNAIGQPGLPGCAVVEVVSAVVSDENANPFATTGTFLPPQ